MSIDILFRRFAIVEYAADASAANPGQQEDFIALTFDSFQNSML
jgi:hypothetical protein